MATKLAVFAHLDDRFVPVGLLAMTESRTEVLTLGFRYGTIYIDRPQALEIDPISLPLADRAALRGKGLRPIEGLMLFGGIRDAAPDAWARHHLTPPAICFKRSQG